MEAQKFHIYNQKNTVVEEAFSFVKANFDFSNAEKQYRSLSVISSSPKEGKTTIAINLSISFAKGGVKTLLVDADLRKSFEVKRLSAEFKKGLSDYLTGNAKFEDVISASNIDNLHYISCGSKVNNPSSFLSSKTFNEFLKVIGSKYELVIFDTPAVFSVSDAYIIASKTDATILAVKAGEVKLPKLKMVKEELKKANANVVGVVLNRVDHSEYRRSFEAYDYFNDELKFNKLLKSQNK